MSKFLGKLIELVQDGKWIEWKKVVEHADKETLVYIRDHARYGWKYFTSDDWMDAEYKMQLFKRIAERLHDMEVHEWFWETFKEVMKP